MAKLPKLLSRYLVTVVMIPTIIGLHMSWSAIQKNRSLVKENEEIDLPVVTFYKYCLRRLAAGETKTTDESAKAQSS